MNCEDAGKRIKKKNKIFHVLWGSREIWVLKPHLFYTIWSPRLGNSDIHKKIDLHIGKTFCLHPYNIPKSVFLCYPKCSQFIMKINHHMESPIMVVFFWAKVNLSS